MVLPSTQHLCDKLVANDPDLTEVIISLSFMSDKCVQVVSEALKKNIVVETLKIRRDISRCRLSLPATLSLVSVIATHPKLKTIRFESINFEDFSPLAVAIKQKENVTSLSLQSFTPSQVNESLKMLLEENAIESLTVRVPSSMQYEPLDLAGALRSNRSLKTVELASLRCTLNGQGHDNIPHDTLRELLLLLQENQNLEAITLEGIEVSVDVVSRIALAAVNHKSLKKFKLRKCRLDDYATQHLGDMLKKSTVLLEADFRGCSITSKGFNCLISGLTNPDTRSNLETLIVSSMAIGDTGASHLERLLALNGTVKSLYAQSNKITCVGASAIAAGLNKNTTLENLELCGNRIGPEGSAEMASVLRSNRTLKKLRVDDGYISLFYEMLRVNTTLESICTDTFGIDALQALIAALPHMHGIKNISAYTSVQGFTSEMADDFVRALELNTSLETQTILKQRYDTPASERIMPRVDYLLKLNRAGRRIIKSPGSVPRSYWPLILGRSSKDADAIFFFLREKADAIFPEPSFSRQGRLVEELSPDSNVSSPADSDVTNLADSLAEDSDIHTREVQELLEPEKAIRDQLSAEIARADRAEARADRAEARADRAEARADRAETGLEALRGENIKLKAQLEEAIKLLSPMMELGAGAILVLGGNEIQEGADANHGDEVEVGDDESASHSHASGN